MDINNYSYAPYMLDGEKESSKKTRLEMLQDRRALILYYMVDQVPFYQDAKLEDKNYIYDSMMQVLNNISWNQLAALCGDYKILSWKAYTEVNHEHKKVLCSPGNKRKR